MGGLLFIYLVLLLSVIRCNKLKVGVCENFIQILVIYLQRKLLAWTNYDIKGWYLIRLYIDGSIGLLLWRRVSKAAPWSNNLSKFHTTSREPRYPLQRYAKLVHSQ